MQKFHESTISTDPELKTMIEDILVRLKTSPHPGEGRGNEYGDTTISGGYVHQGNVDGNVTVNYYFGNSEPAFVIQETKPRTHSHLRQKKVSQSPRLEGHALSVRARTFESCVIAGPRLPYGQRQHSGQLIQVSVTSDDQTTCTPANIRADQIKKFNTNLPPDTRTSIPSHVSSEIAELNRERQWVGMKELATFKKQYMSNQIPSFIIPTPRPTVHELEQGLRHIFYPTSRNSSCQDDSMRQQLATTTTRWTQGLSGLLQIHY